MGTNNQNQRSITLLTSGTQKTNRKTGPSLQNKPSPGLVLFLYDLQSGNRVGAILTTPEPTQS